MKAVLSIFTGMFVLGAAAAWLTLPGMQTARDDSRAREPQAMSPLPGTDRPVPSNGDLIGNSKAWLKKASESRSGPYGDEISRLTDDEIRVALEESLENRDFLLNTKGARALVSSLVAEWLKRDCAAASAWFLTLPSSIRGGDMTFHFSRAWPPERAAEGLAFVKANPAMFESTSPWAILVKNIEARAADGPASVIALLGEFRESKLGLSFENQADFPENFDFASLVASPEMAELMKVGQGKFFLAGWYKQDREACFEWVIKNGEALDLTTMLGNEAETSLDGVRWLGSKYESMSPSQRESMVWRIPPGSPEFIKDLTSGIRDEAVADTLRSLATDWVFGGMAPQAMEVLGTMRDPAHRVRVLEEAARSEMRSRPLRESIRPLTPGDEQILRKHLQEWGATPEQTEAIVTKYQRLE